MIAYKLQANGQATDIRFVSDDYIASVDEILIEGDVLPNPMTLHSIDYLKQLKIADTKAEAARRIEAILPDWKVNRHRDQLELAIPTTLTVEDYALKQQKRQAIRDASNVIEDYIQAITDRAEIENLDIKNHPAWPTE